MSEDVQLDCLVEKSKTEIKTEVQKITQSVTRILLLGGPQFVEAILVSLLETNKNLAEQLKLKTNIKFEETP